VVPGSLDDARRRCAEWLAALPDSLRSIGAAPPCPVHVEIASHGRSLAPAARLWQARTMAKAKAKAAAKPAVAGFAGFDRKAMQFWHELAAEMNRDWFLANKQRYEAQWVQPMTALLAGASAKLAPAYRGIKLGAPGCCASTATCASPGTSLPTRPGSAPASRSASASRTRE
jgi:hypothetical protein